MTAEAHDWSAYKVGKGSKVAVKYNPENDNFMMFLATPKTKDTHPVLLETDENEHRTIFNLSRNAAQAMILGFTEQAKHTPEKAI